MKLPNVKGLLRVGKAFAIANRPEILFGTSVAATVGSVILAAKGGYEAGQMVLREEFSDLDLVSTEAKSKTLSNREKAELTWLCYMPATIGTIGALGATTGLHLVHVKEKKQLAQFTLAALNEVKESAKQFEKENLGVLTPDEKEAIISERAANHSGTALLSSSDGTIEELYLVRDPITGRDVWSNKARMEEAITEVGNQVNGSDCCSLNGFYDEAGYNRVTLGDEVGWSGVIPTISWCDVNGFPIAGVRDDGRPYRGFRFLPEPAKDWDSVYH